MENLLFAGTSLKGLFRELKNDAKTFVKEEVELLKREMAEKISYCARNATTLAIGGSLAYAGLIVFFAGLGVLLGYVFEKLGLAPALANFIGLSAVGLLVMIIGAVMVLKGVKAFSKASLAPEKTIETIKNLTGQPVNIPESDKKEEAPKPSPEELKQAALATEDHMGETLEEIAYRTSPTRLKEKAVRRVRTHPYASSMLALGSGLISSFILSRKIKRVFKG